MKMAYSACPQRNPSFSCTVLCYFNKNMDSFLTKAVFSICFFPYTPCVLNYKKLWFFRYIIFKMYLYIVYISKCIAKNMYLEIPKTSYNLERREWDDKQRNSLPSGFAALSSLFLSVLLK
jgi:hypothetical protein